MSKISQEIVTVKFSKIVEDDDSGTYVTAANLQSAIQSSVSSLFSFNTITEVEIVANLLIEGNSFPVSNASGTGAIATLDFPEQGSAPFQPGQTIVVRNVTNPSTYNGTYTVLTCGNSNVTFASTATGNYQLYDTLPITDISGNGTVVTVEYSTQLSAPYAVGSYVFIEDVDPSAYNVTNIVPVVLTCNTTAVTYSSTATGSYVSGGNISLLEFLPANVGTITEIS